MQVQSVILDSGDKVSVGDDIIATGADGKVRIALYVEKLLLSL